MGILILLGHFLVPFFLLLSRDLKRSPPALAALSAWMLVIHYIDVYGGDAGRRRRPAGPALDAPHLLRRLGGVSVAAALWLFRAARPVPVRDPFLEDALRYVQP